MFMTVGCNYFLLLGLGQPKSAAICLLVITGVPWRPCQEFRWVCYPNWHLIDVGQHYDMMMTFDVLSKELYSLKQGSRENVAEFGVCLLQQVHILQSEYPERIQQEHMEEMKQDHFYEGLKPKYQCILANKVDDKHPLATTTWSLQSVSWKDTQKPEIPCSQRPPQLEDWMLLSHRHQGICFPLGSWRAIVHSLLDLPKWKALELKRTWV